MEIRQGGAQVFRRLDTTEVLLLKLLQVHTWEELISVLFQIPETILPLLGASLTAYDQVSGSRSVVAERNLSPESLNYPDPSCYFWARKFNQAVISPCQCSKQTGGQSPRLCLPLTNIQQQVYVLHLYLPKNVQVSSVGFSLLEELAPASVRTVEYLHSRQEALQQQAVRQDEKNHIARHLHDTLAHNLACLRFKLDHIAYDSNSLNGANIAQKAMELRDIADECYDCVREFLTSLVEEGDDDIDLYSAIEEYISALRQTVPLEIDYEEKGERKQFSSSVQRVIFFIIREALRNVEKHANASRATVTLSWGRSSFRVTILDDGKGLNQAETRRQRGHYGLRMMREYAQEIDGSLVITSSAGSGAEISLILPIE